MSETEVRACLLSLRERGVAPGTFKINHGGIQFLYRWTLDRDWPAAFRRHLAPDHKLVVLDDLKFRVHSGE